MPYKDPEIQRAAKRESARMRRAGECGTQRRPTLPELDALRLESARTALLLLNEQVRAVLGLHVDKPCEIMGKAKTIAYLLSVGMKILGAAQSEMQFDTFEGRFKEFLYQEPPCQE